jgi:predicted nuclease of predicted toxin-antitoxin system
MRLLLDQNLSPRLAARPADVYPHSAHVSALGLEQADDRAVCSEETGILLLS